MSIQEKVLAGAGICNMPLTPEENKQLILRAVQEHPGLTGPQLTRMLGLPVWMAQSFLPQLERRRLVRCEHNSDRDRTRHWYAVEKKNLPTC